MSAKDNGGPAFPFGQTDEQSGQLVNDWGSEGMTLRDYFAAKALTMVSAGNEHTDMVEWGYRHFAEYAYAMADAMIAERAK